MQIFDENIKNDVDDMNAYVYFENGVFITAKAFGVKGEAYGEFVLVNDISGYQETITNPLYKDKFIVFTMPEIGICGVNENDNESSNIQVSSVFIRNFDNFVSNFRATGDLKTFFKKHDKFGVYDIDTKFLTQIIVDNPNIKAIVSTEISDKAVLKEKLNSHDFSYMAQKRPVSYYSYGLFNFEKQDFNLENPKESLLLISSGVKNSFLQELVNSGFGVFVASANKSEVENTLATHDIKAICVYGQNFFDNDCLDFIINSNLPILACGHASSVIDEKFASEYKNSATVFDENNLVTFKIGKNIKSFVLKNDYKSPNYLRTILKTFFDEVNE